MSHPPGSIRDAIVGFLASSGSAATVGQISDAVALQIGAVPSSSVRSYLNLNTPGIFERVGRGSYRLSIPATDPAGANAAFTPAFQMGQATYFQADCFDWLAHREPNSVHAVVTDPPYGLLEYTPEEQSKLATGKGGVWRIPPSFDGHKRAPLPRFTILGSEQLEALYGFFLRLGKALLRVIVPGANVLVASSSLLAHIVTSAMATSGLEVRGSIMRLVMTMRGGDRPKNAHKEYPDVSVMPRSMWEPWIMLRRPLEGRVQDNLRQWKTGGFRRISDALPFADVIKSAPTSKTERAFAPHPSLKPQAFMRQLVRGVLPLGEGVILDPFAGGGSTLAAANAVGHTSIGVDSDPRYVAIARNGIEKLALIAPINPIAPELSNSSSIKSGSARSKSTTRVAAKVSDRHVS